MEILWDCHSVEISSSDHSNDTTTTTLLTLPVCTVDCALRQSQVELMSLVTFELKAYTRSLTK